MTPTATATATGAGAGAGAAVSVVPQAVFRALPRGSVLTVRVDVPEPWNIQVEAR